MLLRTIATCLLFTVSYHCIAQESIGPGDWPMYNQDVLGWRFNQDEKSLNPSNAKDLVEKWRFPAKTSLTQPDRSGTTHETLSGALVSVRRAAQRDA